MVIGLDGASWGLLDRFMESGLMPELARLVRAGARAPLRSVVPPMTATAWTTFVTGKGPGRHGIYDWTEPVGHSYVYEPVDSSRIDSPTIFEILSGAGRRAATVNLPLTWPCRPLNGVAVSGMLTPSRDAPGFTWPADFAGVIDRVVPDYSIDTRLATGPGDVVPFCRRLERMIEQRGRLVRHLLEQEPWDLFVSVWVEMDRVQHCLWHLIDPGHPGYDADGARRFGPGILQVYRLLDRRIGEMVELAGPDCDVVFVSDHGFGPCRAKVFLNRWLAREGFLRFQPGGDELRGRLNRVRGMLDRAGLDTRRIVRAARRHGASRLLASRGAALSRFASGIDWEHTAVFSHGTNSMRINLRGREPRGSVAPADYDDTRRRLCDRLLAMRDPEGRRVIHRVANREDLYEGPSLDRASDVLIAEHDDSVWFYYSEGEMPEAIFEPSGWASGNHEPEGIFLGVGPSFAEGLSFRGAAIADVAPTLLAILGVPIPDDVDGRILRDSLRPGFRPRVLWREATPWEGRSSSAFDEDQRREVEDRLRGLGYLR